MDRYRQVDKYSLGKNRARGKIQPMDWYSYGVNSLGKVKPGDKYRNGEKYSLGIGTHMDTTTI